MLKAKKSDSVNILMCQLVIKHGEV